MLADSVKHMGLLSQLNISKALDLNFHLGINLDQALDPSQNESLVLASERKLNNF